MERETLLKMELDLQPAELDGARNSVRKRILIFSQHRNIAHIDNNVFLKLSDCKKYFTLII